MPQFRLAEVYLEGNYVPKNSAKAFELFLKAAEQKMPTAQFNVGVMYERGLGVKADLNQALAWFRAAEKNGYKQATAKVGQLEQTLKNASSN